MRKLYIFMFAVLCIASTVTSECFATDKRPSKVAGFNVKKAQSTNDMQDNLLVDNYEPVTLTFEKYCEDSWTYETTGAEFSDLVLKTKLNNMTKVAFDYLYEAECYADGLTPDLNDAKIVTPDSRIRTIGGDNANNSQRGYHLKLYNFGNDIFGNGGTPNLQGDNATKVESSNSFEDKELGLAIYWPSNEDTIGHRFSWEFTKEEMEYLTHHVKDTDQPVTLTRWFRFNAKDILGNGNLIAPYPYIWVKMTINLKRIAQVADKFTTKITHYWFGWNTGTAAQADPNGAEGSWSAVVADIQEPRKDQYINRYPFIIRSTLIGNVESTGGTPALTGALKKKYFFAPKDVIVKGEIVSNGAKEPVEVKISAESNQLYCKYMQAGLTFDKNAKGDVPLLANVRMTDIHTFATAQRADGTWSWDTNYSNVVRWCAIDYDRGAFTNDKLYATYNGTTVAIAELDQLTGEIALIKNDMTKFVLSLVGYEGNKHENINKELRNWVSVVASDSCGLAKDMVYEHTPDLQSFMVSWQRPINMNPLPDQVCLDTDTTETIIYILDLLRLYDWRGDKGTEYPKAPYNQGYMYDGQYWFWAYYGVNGITIDMDPAHVYTNMYQTDVAVFRPLNTVTTQAVLTAWDKLQTINDGKTQLATYTFDLLSPVAYNDPAKEEALEIYMGLKPDVAAGEKAGDPSQLLRKERFGAIYYANNGDDDLEFDLKIPVTIHYTWGDLSDILNVHIERRATGLNKITALTKPVNVYSLDGKLIRKNTTTLTGLKGVYIVGGKKMFLE